MWVMEVIIDSFMNLLKSVEIDWNIVCLFFLILKFVYEYVRMKNSNSKSVKLRKKYLNNMLRNQFLKVRLTNI